MACLRCVFYFPGSSIFMGLHPSLLFMQVRNTSAVLGIPRARSKSPGLKKSSSFRMDCSGLPLRSISGNLSSFGKGLYLLWHLNSLGATLDDLLDAFAFPELMKVGVQNVEAQTHRAFNDDRLSGLFADLGCYGLAMSIFRYACGPASNPISSFSAPRHQAVPLCRAAHCFSSPLRSASGGGLRPRTTPRGFDAERPARASRAQLPLAYAPGH